MFLRTGFDYLIESLSIFELIELAEEAKEISERTK